LPCLGEEDLSFANELLKFAMEQDAVIAQTADRMNLVRHGVNRCAVVEPIAERKGRSSVVSDAKRRTPPKLPLAAMLQLSATNTNGTAVRRSE
jgi:hypothetical protein